MGTRDQPGSPGGSLECLAGPPRSVVGYRDHWKAPLEEPPARSGAASRTRGRLVRVLGPHGSGTAVGESLELGGCSTATLIGSFSHV